MRNQPLRGNAVRTEVWVSRNCSLVYKGKSGVRTSHMIGGWRRTTGGSSWPRGWTRRATGPPARRASPKPFGQTGLSYTFACTVCGKTFKRGTYDATLNPHKNKQGWPCLGRIGTLK